MPRVTDSDKLIPKIYRRKYDDFGLFFYVRGQKDIMPALSMTKAIENFYRSIGEDNYDLQCSINTFIRMTHEFFELQRCEP